MTSTERLELSFGLATAAVASALSLFVLRFDWIKSITVERQFEWRSELTFVSLLFMLPGLLVAAGSFAEAARRKWWGRVVIGLGCVVVAGTLVFLVMALPFVGIGTYALLNVSLALLAFLTLGASFMPKSNQTFQK